MSLGKTYRCCWLFVCVFLFIFSNLHWLNEKDSVLILCPARWVVLINFLYITIYYGNGFTNDSNRFDDNQLNSQIWTKMGPNLRHFPGVVAKSSKYKGGKYCCGVVVITTAKPHLSVPELYNKIWFIPFPSRTKQADRK